MLKITTQIGAGVLRFGLEGALAGAWVKELELCWNSAAVTRQIYPLHVDLSSVTFIDAEGKELLARMYREGAELSATGCMNNCIVEEILRSVKREVG